MGVHDSRFELRVRVQQPRQAASPGSCLRQATCGDAIQEVCDTREIGWQGHLPERESTHARWPSSGTCKAGEPGVDGQVRTWQSEKGSTCTRARPPVWAPLG
eukprot:357433-Chlamydomonas_euryale.AAC.9